MLVQRTTILCLASLTASLSYAAGSERSVAEPSVSLCVVTQEGCHVPGSIVRVTLELGESDHPITGGQLALDYDPTHLDLLDISPGHTCVPDSPFTLELYEDVQEAYGRIHYSVGVGLGGPPGCSGPATMACIRFLALDRTDSVVCLSPEFMSNFLSDEDGNQVTIDNTTDCPAESQPPTVSCAEIESADTCMCDTVAPDCSAWDDDCNVGVCREDTAVCEPEPANEGGPCDDGYECTTTDLCVSGVCIGSGCTNPSVCVVADVGCYAFDGAHVRLELGEGDALVKGGQFIIRYDPDALSFRSIAPGVACSPESPFVLEVFEQVDESAGEIVYAVAIAFENGTPGTEGPATLACLEFASVDDTESDVCLLSAVNQPSSMLINNLGHEVSIYNLGDCPPDSPPPALSCDHVQVDEDCTCTTGTADCSVLDAQCRIGVCNEQTGRCETVPINQGDECDDGDACTPHDRCIAGECKGFGSICTDPSLCIVEDDCVGPGIPNAVSIVLGEGDAAVVGGQFSIFYNPDTVTFIGIEPGTACDASSPFALELFKNVDEENGDIFYAVGIDFAAGTAGTTGPATMACLSFIARKSRPDEVCIFSGVNPMTTLLVDENGQSVTIYNRQDCPIDYPPPILSCTEICTIPTVGGWGLLIIALLLLTVGKIRFGRRPSLS